MQNESNNQKKNNNDDLYVCMEIAASESIPELNVEPQKANQDDK